MTQRTIIISIRLTPEEEETLRKAVKEADVKSLSGYIRKSALWNANNPTAQIPCLIKEQIDEVIMQINMLFSLLYMNPAPDKYQIRNLIERIEQKIRRWLG
ncbi:plasmid mobilization protein [Terasakiella pusilla]|uniref:plasmid mobilization protein n=1 Tax=Terasakiella pusilla TaxID=64973 RepID=UPI003AA8DE55